MPVIDIEPATRTLAELVRGVPDELLGAPTPCPAYSVGDLVEHIGGLTLAFTAAAEKSFDAPGVTGAPSGDASRLPADWRERIPRDLQRLADAWRDPDAWTGMTQAGGIDLPGDVCGLVALDEVVIHGWDLARATGRQYTVTPEVLDTVERFVAPFSVPGAEDQRAGMFGPVVPVPGDAPLLDRVVGMAGRDPEWAPS